VATHPELERLLRSPDALADVRAAADSLAQRDDRGTAGQAAQAAYLSAIAAQIVAAGHELAPAAQQLMDADALAVRLAAARGRHEAYAAEVAEQAAAEIRLHEQLQALEKERAAARAAAEVERVEQEKREAEHRARVARNASLAAKLRRVRSSELRIGGGANPKTYSTNELLRNAENGSFSVAQAIEWEAAIIAASAGA
jgi:hypothetical protein